MKIRLGVMLLSLAVMLGCSHTARLYPVQGPLSAQTPVPVLLAKITGALTPADISVVMGDGEVCKGHWELVRRPKPGKGENTATAPETDGMPAIWDTIYGQGFYLSHVLGARLYAKAVVNGERGTVLNVEMYKPEGEHEGNPVAAIKGVAKDNKDNVYKLTF